MGIFHFSIIIKNSFKIKYSPPRQVATIEFMRKKLPLLALFLFFFVSIPWAYGEGNGGIGVILEFLPQKKIHRIRAVFQGSPAARAKIQAGEEIISIDGQATEKMSFEELGKRIRGNPGDAVTLVLRSPGSKQSRELKLIRAAPNTVSPLIEGVSGGPGISIPRTSFTEAEKEKVKNVIRQLKTSAEQKEMEKLLLELKEGKVIKSDFFKILKAKFPSYH